MISSKTFLPALGIAIVLVALGSLGWYLFAPVEHQEVGTPMPSGTQAGTISGTTMYPSEFNPAQRVCAQSIKDAGYQRCVDVAEQTGQQVPTFSIKVAPGTYEVYAMIKNPSDLGLTESRRAYWTEFVACGLLASCASHAHIEVKVGSGQAVTGVSPHDWYQ